VLAHRPERRAADGRDRGADDHGALRLELGAPDTPYLGHRYTHTLNTFVDARTQDTHVRAHAGMHTRARAGRDALLQRVHTADQVLVRQLGRRGGPGAVQPRKARHGEGRGAAGAAAAPQVPFGWSRAGAAGGAAAHSRLATLRARMRSRALTCRSSFFQVCFSDTTPAATER
jgi:hypothetical protein